MSSVSYPTPLHGKATKEKKDPLQKKTSESSNSEGKEKFTFYTQNGRVVTCPYTTTVNKDGLIVNSCSSMPNKYYEFSNLPEYNTTVPGCCTAVFKGNPVTSIPWCGPMSLPVPVECKPNFVLLTDSDDILVSVANNVDRKYNCLVVRGTVDTATCFFLRHIKKELGNQIPILALVDYDPMSLKLLSLYVKWTSEKMPLELACVDLDIKWLGLRRIHLDVADNALEPEDLKKLEFHG
ncbi:uncharacterized protein LOC110730344 isoform X1 [Chenopodium quinoa]|uniref:uncharacterized protein LOC110730344 isoform X1 n=1 Tax=Chenopodium quinoa TaxID=63459 RepID=UPI000B7850A1|nr:uncharacterized protein LOC110730344 isoform X1 [Chenopodium quinoa]